MPVSHSSRSLAVLLVTALATSSAVANAKSSTCSPRFESQIRADFFDGNRVSSQKVDQTIARLKQKKLEIGAIDAGNEVLKADQKGKAVKQKKIDKAIDKSKSLFALDAAIQAAQSMKTASSFAQVCDAATAVSDLEGAVRIEGTLPAFTEVRQTVLAVLSTWKVPKRSAPSAEASNLMNPLAGEPMSAADIAAASARGVDLSTLNPMPGSVFYTPLKNISSLDVRQAALGSTLPVYNGIGDVFPSENTFVYDSVKQSDTRPKLETHVEGNKDTKFKLKFEAEYHADPAVGALMMTLGFPSDLSKYAKHIKVVLPKGTSFHDVKRDWEAYFSRDRVIHNPTIEDDIETTGTDSQGRTYIIFKEGSIEAHPDSLKRIGGWKYADGDHNSRREVRAMTLIQMWLDNSDLKEFGNNNILLKTNSDGSVTRTLFNSDVGHALGGLFLEMPRLFAWNMISSATGSTIDFKFRALHPLSFQNDMTLADARWAARLIAKLTRQQIETAFALSGWDDCIQKSYVERAISRRNDLVSGLGLVGARQDDGSTIALLPVAADRRAYDLNVICKSNPNLRQEDVAYGFNANTLVSPVLKTAKQQLFALARASLDGEKRLTIDTRNFRLGGPRPVAEVIFNINREIQRNPNPKTEQDLFLVKDHFELGVRGGVAVGPYADVVERYSWELAYPARSLQEGGANNGFIINLLLPREACEGRLPDSYVLKTEHSVEVETGVEAENLTALITPKGKIGVSRLRLWRSIYDHRDGKKAVLYRDRQNFTQAEADLFLRVSILELPVFQQLKNWGRAIGKGVILTADELNNPATAAAVDKAVIEGDFSALASRETDFFSDDDFTHSLRKWDLIVLNGRAEKRLDRVEIATDQKKNVVQFKTSKGSTLAFFSTRIEKNVAVELYADPAAPSEMELQVNVMGTDTQTSDKEMAQKYLRFVNGLSVTGRPLIPLTPALGYTTNGTWGNTLTQSDTTYSSTAMNRILNASPDMFWNALAASMTISRSDLETMRTGDDSTDQEDSLIEHANAFLKEVARAQAETKIEKKMSRLAEAFRKAIFVDGKDFYNPVILGALNRIAGTDAIYSRNLITVPQPLMMNLLEGAPMFGRIGLPMKEKLKYLVFSPVTALDLYDMFDTWF